MLLINKHIFQIFHLPKISRSFIVSLIVGIIFAADIFAIQPQSFGQAKHIIKKHLLNDLQTIYSGCAIKNNKIDFTSCGFTPNPAIARDVVLEFEHMLPVSHAKHHFLCWRMPLCVDKNGRIFKGRRCCQQIDPKFRALEGELYNLMPEIGHINQARSDFKFTQFPNLEHVKLQSYRGLPIYIDQNRRKIEPRDLAKGIVARANLYVSDAYKIRLSPQQLKLFQIWNKKFPPTQMELVWANKIATITGVENKYISDWKHYINNNHKDFQKETNSSSPSYTNSAATDPIY